MATISSIGVGSNLPLNDLLTSLRNNENHALALIQSRQVAVQTKVSAYSKLQGAVSTLQTAAKAVGKPEAFGALKATTAADAFSATADKTAIAGQYSIQVDTLASAQTLVADGRAERDAAIGAGGSVTITLANGESHTVDLTGKDTSLNGLVAALNGDPDSGVNATLVNDGSGAAHRLLLTSRATGTESAVASITVADNAELEAFLAYDKAVGTGGFTEQAATNAQLSINGISITSQTNTIEDAIDGVALTLKQTTDKAATLSVTRDDTAATKAINDFVKAYNGLLGTIKSLTSYNVDTQASSALTGDSLARRVQTEMRGALNGALDDIDGLSLSRIGITTDPKSGELKVDDAKLAKALSSNLEGVTSLFTGTNGAGTRVANAAEAFTRSDGLFSATTDSLNETAKQMQRQYDATADRIDQRMETYRQQFTQLDAMVAQMNSLSSYLTQQLSMLSNLSKSDK
ncbi:flagellar filament capping protein FliD [Castellaniella sp. GW247-6E4]|uniref:flagellar filament capping protein FliD n=1 Tax=Castellaniella sp. GW247-6E4 TaxID=3140380 RepID=UPI0033149A87